MLLILSARTTLHRTYRARGKISSITTACHGASALFSAMLMQFWLSSGFDTAVGNVTFLWIIDPFSSFLFVHFYLLIFIWLFLCIWFGFSSSPWFLTSSCYFSYLIIFNFCLPPGMLIFSSVSFLIGLFGYLTLPETKGKN